MTWGPALTGLIVLTIVGPGIVYVVGRLRSRAPWATSRRNIVRGDRHPAIRLTMSGDTGPKASVTGRPTRRAGMS